MSSDRAQLLSMGFEEARVDWALRATKSSGLQPALDHLLNNMDNPIPSASESNASSSSGPAAGAAGDDDEEDGDREALAAHIAKMGGKPADADVAEARSVKCSDCGKIFKNSSLVSFHAEKSGHSNFEESTEEFVPLTEEQKAAKLKELKERLAEKRAKQAIEDQKAARQNEILRRKAGREQEKAKDDMKQKEALKIAAQAKQDKIDDAKARAAIRAQIEEDKRARAEKAALDKAIRAGENPPPESSSKAGPALGSAVKAAAAATSGKGSDNPETRLQIRLSSGGAPLIKAFPSDSPLTLVAEFIASENLQYNADSVKLSTTFPRKTFTAAEMKKTLKENGLTPSAVLMAN